MSDGGAGTTESPFATTAVSVETATPMETLVPSTPTETPEAQTGIGTDDNPVDVRVGGEVPEGQTLTITVQRRGADEPLLETTVAADSTTRGWNVVSSHTSGVYLLTARLTDGPESSVEWDLDEQSAGGYYTVFVDDDGSIRWRYAIP